MENSDVGCGLGFRGCQVVVGFVFGGWDLAYLTVEAGVELANGRTRDRTLIGLRR